MALFDFLKPTKRNTPGQNYLAALAGIGTENSVAINQNTALTFSAVFAAVRILSESIASLPVNLYKKTIDGTRSIQNANPLQALISVEPNQMMTSYNFFNAMVSNLVLQGNAYAFISRNGTGRPEALHILDPQNVKILYHENEVFYEIKKVELPVPATEILHFTGLSFDGIKGKSPIEVQRDTLSLAVSANKYGGQFFTNAATPKGVLQHPGKITKEAADRLRSSWNQSYGGVYNAHKTAVLEEGMTFKTIQMNPQDVDFLNTRKFQVNEIARIFRIPPHLLADLERATFSNIEAQQIDFVVHTIRPYLVNIEQEMNKKLLRETEKKDHYVKFSIQGLLRGDSEARSKYYQTLNQIGVLSINEIRAFEDMNPVADGDTHYYPLNFAPINQPNNGDNELSE
tara:strand:+ start:316 stop:1515 length:1200 start_codon:yes stop_codon:yes gene_type:complete